MDQNDLPDFLQINGFRPKPGMFGAGGRRTVSAQRSPARLIPPPGAMAFAPVPAAAPVAQAAFPTSGLTFDPTVGGALSLPSPEVDFMPAAPRTAAPGKLGYRVPPPEAIAAAQAKQRRWGVPASVSLAQFATEGRWGEAMPKDSNNPFGVKAVPGQPSVRAQTHEYVGGKLVSKPQYFRKYASLEDAWEGRSKMLATSKLYAKARPYLNDPDAFVDAIAGTYAPGNPTYATTLKHVMKANHLYQYDKLPPDAAQ